MKKLFMYVFLLLFFVACATKTPPTTDISNAKMALVKATSENAKRYASEDVARLNGKYKKLQALMAQKRYEQAKFLAQEIQADARLLEQKSERIMMEKRVQKLQGEINRINKDFTAIKE